MNKLKNILLILLIYFFALSCNLPRIVSKELPRNPTSYIFKMKMDSVGSFFQKSYFKYHNGLKFDLEDIYYYPNWKGSSAPESATKALSMDAQRNDVWMILKVDSSLTYFSKKRKTLEYLMECRAHFSMVNDSMTKIEIQVLNAAVHIRDRLLPGPPHFVNNPVYKKVLPTTIEEYKILQCFGKGLGEFNEMPPINL